MKKVNVKEAVEILKDGELVLLPTETVYGLAADGLNSEAVTKIFEAKGRPRGNPLILHVASEEMLGALVTNVPAKARLLINKFWPGPLTLVLDKSEIVPEIVTGGLSTVCVRMPRQEDALAVIRALGRPLAAPSANKSGRPSPTNLKDLEKEMPALPVLDGGQTELGLESTVVDARGDLVEVLRLGSLSINDIENCLGEKVVLGNKDKLKSPGQAFKHYSPKGEVVLVWPWESFGEKISTKNNPSYTAVEEAYADLYERYRCGIIVSSTRESLYFGYELLALGKDSDEQAKNLFAILHQTEDLGWEKVIVDMTDIDTGLGLAPTVVERLQRAAEAMNTARRALRPQKL